MIEFCEQFHHRADFDVEFWADQNGVPVRLAVKKDS